jgi:crossover junction endodeoxyribonuclease RusA
VGWTEKDYQALLARKARERLRSGALLQGASPPVLAGGVRYALVLAYPPSINHYYQLVRRRLILSEAAEVFRAEVARVVAQRWISPPCLTGRLIVEITWHAPDERARDIDNPTKALLDALQHAGMYVNDSQIDHLLQHRGAVTLPAYTAVSIGDVSSSQ